jgi:hypothetical protein
MGLFGSKPATTTATSAIPALAPAPAPSALSTLTSTTTSAASAVVNRSGNIVRIVTTVIGASFLLLLGIVIYNYFRRRQGLSEVTVFSDKSSGDKLPSPTDGKARTVIPAAEVPVGAGTDYGLQFWMFIKDWDYKFSQEKQVLKRIQATNANETSPKITLDPTDNTLRVTVAIYPNSQSAGAASTTTTSSTGDSFSCTVENVPLQSWFSVSVTVFQRNLEIYINGRLVKSCVLPGIPKPVVGDIVLGDNGGFSGSLCNLKSYGSMLGPEDAQAFFAAGTNCQAPTPTKGVPIDKDSVFITLFGYTFRFSTLDKAGKELSSYTL